MKLDLSSLASVKSFVEEFTLKYSRLDILVNNAGQVNDTFITTVDKIEQTMQCNHISVTYLTTLLFPLLQKSKGRVVSLSSEVHTFAKFDVEDWSRTLETNDLEALKAKYTSGFGLYGIAKIGTNYMTKFFTKYAEIYSANNNLDYVVPFVCLHPGTVHSDLMNISKVKGIQVVILMLMWPFQMLLFKTEFVGAQTTLHLCYIDADKISRGSYYADCKVCRESKDVADKSKFNAFMRYTFNLIKKHQKINIDENEVLS